MQFKFLAIILLSLMSSCQFTPQKVESEKDLLIGEDSSNVKVLIRQIDKGEILWTKNYQLGTTASIEIGTHTVSIICEFSHSWGKVLSPGNLDINIKPNATYKISGILSKSDDTCLVSTNIK